MVTRREEEFGTQAHVHATVRLAKWRIGAKTWVDLIIFHY